MSLHRYQRGLRQLGMGAGSHLARPPAVLPEPDVKPGPDPLRFAVQYTADNAASSHSAETGGAWGQSAGDYLYNIAFTIGNAPFLGSSEEPAWTPNLATLAPAAPRRAYAWQRISGGAGTDGQFYTWDGSVAVGTLTIAVHETGLAHWTSERWTSGPDTSFSFPDFEVHRALMVLVQSDAGTTVTDATLQFRSDGADVGILEVWTFEGVTSGTTEVDVDAVALSGDIQWAILVDLYTP